MITIIKNRTLDANFKKLKLIPAAELKDYRIQLSGPNSYVPHVVNENTGEPSYDAHMVLLDTFTNELCVFEWTSHPHGVLGSMPNGPASISTIVTDYSGRYVTPPATSLTLFNPHATQPRYTQDVMGDGSIITMFEPSAASNIEPMLSVAAQVLRDGTEVKTVTFKRVTAQNEMDGKGTTWRLLNGYLCIVQDSSVWYHSNAGMVPLTIDQAIELDLNPIIGLCDSNALYGLESKLITHAPTYHHMGATGSAINPYNNVYFKPNDGMPSYGNQEFSPQYYQPPVYAPKVHKSNKY